MEPVKLTGRGFITISTGMDSHSEKDWMLQEAENLVMRTMKMEIAFREKELNTDGMAEGIYSTASAQ